MNGCVNDRHPIQGVPLDCRKRTCWLHVILGAKHWLREILIILQYSHIEFRHIHLDSYVAVVLTRAGYLHGTLSLMESEVAECYYVQTALPV